MRRLLLAWHAKSSWGDPVLTDHDRPLNARGYRAAQLVGAALSELGCMPDVVALEHRDPHARDLGAMEPHLGGHPRVEFHRALYLAAPRDVLAAIADAADEAETVMVLGHAVAIVDLSSDSWTGADQSGELRHFILPRRLE